MSKRKKESPKSSHMASGVNKSKNMDTVMLKPREIIPIMAQMSDPLGSYTGAPAGLFGETPVQDADDL
ncbi:MAG: hypothetical protein FWH07_06235 [Oscillospiraceae bacterium]|nr:hypothetical protein [Oscillospiraceae bacterium]